MCYGGGEGEHDYVDIICIVYIKIFSIQLNSSLPCNCIHRRMKLSLVGGGGGLGLEVEPNA